MIWKQLKLFINNLSIIFRHLIIQTIELINFGNE